MDADRVLGWFEAGTLLRPDPLRPSTVSLALALAAFGGAPVDLDEPALRVQAAIGETEHVILVLADGLGLDLVGALPETSFLRSHLVMELRAVFPSSTAPALTSLATGQWPVQHGLLGWFAYLPERDLHVITLPFRERFTSRPLLSLGVSGTELFDWTSLLRSFKRRPGLLMPSTLADSSYTRSIGGGTGLESYDGLDAAIDRLIRRFKAPQASSYTYFYYPRIDSVSHDHGPSSAAVQHAVELLDVALARLHQGLEGRARIVVSADHGAIDVDSEHKAVIAPSHLSFTLLRTPPSGEPRAPLFHVRPGAAAEFASAFRGQFGGNFALLTAKEVIDLELLGPGPPSATTIARMGDFMALSAGGDALVYSRDKGILNMTGFHGGLDPREVRIPLVVG